jgi:glutamine amidotransferase
MCRLLAFRARHATPLFRLMLAGDNSFAVQSLEHPDGWGLAYFVDGAPHLIKNVLPAITDPVFEKVSLTAQSTAVIAHVRRATAGPVALQNCHPFQSGRWVMAHNGFFRNYPHIRGDLLARISPRWRSRVLGETDSEVYFLLFMSHLSELVDPLETPQRPDRLALALQQTVSLIRSVADFGPPQGRQIADRSWFTTVITDGMVMVGLSSGRPLSYRRVTDASGRTAEVHFSSEHISTKGTEQSSDAWVELGFDEYLGVDADLALSCGRLTTR